MMDIDAAIIKYKEKAEFFKRTTNVAYGLELEQFAEWLEELKALRHFKSNYEHNLNVEYNKGIDDFYDEVLNFEDYIEPVDTSEFGAVLLYSGNDITKTIYDIKEQLKADND